ncbi:leucine-rich PPR motif-containing protein, mitochondrial [Schistocerca nitens]|uniref:leucine-rich PPR motif-containing protein, mitochondrial n=1 Tax=Schistocerca nitens TaxID=7011 RepID=UPI0021182E8C|nr:leucine-rich PPR motif-containing protein, mitochondrial [Schistocerca nitens]
MTTLLRSARFARCFTSAVRGLPLKHVRKDGTQSSSTVNYYINSQFARVLATQVGQTRENQEVNLDRSLRRLDQDVRRTGRITRKELEDVLGDLRHARCATSTQSLLIIRCCGNLVPEESPEVRTKIVNEVWKTLENLGVPLDISHYNALLRVYLENEHEFSPTEFLADLEQKGVEPNRVTYQRLIARYCQRGDIEGATRILEFMREKQLPVNENVFNALIMGHSRADDMESAVGILGVMRQAGLEPSSDTYTTLLCGYAKRGDIDSIRKVFAENQEKNVFLLDKDFMEIIYELAVNGHDKFIDEIIDKMQQLAGYNQDAINLILRLVNHGKEEIAMKILKTMPPPVVPEGHSFSAGNFFIKQLIHVNRPVEKIVSICREMEESGLNNKALVLAAEMSIQSSNVEQACCLLSLLRQDGFPIRPHYFWPLLTSCGRKGDTEGIQDILRRMNVQFGLTVGGETLRDYVIPYLKDQKPEQIVSQLSAAGVTAAAAACSVVCSLLQANKLSDAADLASKYRAYYIPSLLRRPLVQALHTTNDLDSYIRMVRFIHDGMDRAVDVRPTLDEDNISTSGVDKAEIVGQMVLDIVMVYRTNRSAIIRDVLQGLVDQGLSISNSAAERLQEKLSGEELTNDISTLLSKLTTGELTPTPVQRQTGRAAVIQDEQQLKEQIKTLEAKEQSVNGVKRQLLSLYCRNKEIDKAEQLKQELEAQGFVLTAGVQSQLIDMYCHHDKLDEALECLKRLQEKEPDFAIGDLRILKLAGLLIKNNRLQDALRYLKELPRESKAPEKTFVYNATAWRMLNTLAEEGRTDDVKLLLETLAENKFIELNNIMLGPLVKSCIVREDVPQAMQAFEWCVEHHSCTPWKNELARRLIQSENPDMLQHLTDLSTKVHGEINSLYDLVFAFVECGRVRAARKILETPGLRYRTERLSNACERYRQDGQVSTLEGLIEATRDLSYIDRSAIFYQLLLSYCNNEDVDKALGLWTRMQEEDVQPTDKFLFTLGTFLEQKGRTAPFVIPQISQETKTKTREVQHVDKVPATEQILLKEFRKALNNDDLDKALEIKRRAENEAGPKITTMNISKLIEKLVKAGRQSEASKMVFDLLEAGTHPVPHIFRFFLNKLAEAGDTETISRIGSFLTPELKRIVSFDNKLCTAYSTAGKAKEYLENLEKEINSAKDDDLSKLSVSFPRGGAFAILEKEPEILPLYERVAQKYAKHGILSPVNVLWVHLLLKNEDEAARKLWDDFLSKHPQIMYQKVIEVARKEDNLSIVQKLLDYLKTAPVKEQSLGVVYSCILDIHAKHGEIEEALNVLNTAVNDICLENFNRTSLLRLKDQVESQGKVFPHKIPEKRSKSSSSSSSSSDDEKQEPAQR